MSRIFLFYIQLFLDLLATCYGIMRNSLAVVVLDLNILKRFISKWISETMDCWRTQIHLILLR